MSDKPSSPPGRPAAGPAPSSAAYILWPARHAQKALHGPPSAGASQPRAVKLHLHQRRPTTGLVPLAQAARLLTGAHSRQNAKQQRGRSLATRVLGTCCEAAGTPGRPGRAQAQLSGQLTGRRWESAALTASSSLSRPSVRGSYSIRHERTPGLTSLRPSRPCGGVAHAHAQPKRVLWAPAAGACMLVSAQVGDRAHKRSSRCVKAPRCAGLGRSAEHACARTGLHPSRQAPRLGCS